MPQNTPMDRSGYAAAAAAAAKQNAAAVQEDLEALLKKVDKSGGQNSKDGGLNIPNAK